MQTSNITREQVVTEARTWLGTPFRHQGRTKSGCDCIGFPWGVAKNLDLMKDIDLDSPKVKPYLGYGKAPVPSKFLSALREHLVKIELGEVLPADLILFRGKLYPNHLAIVTEHGIIHCDANFGKVVEHGLDAKWKAKRLCAFRFPLFVE